MTRLLIANSYSARNLGDAAIVHLMAREFVARGASVTIMSDDPSDRLRYPYEVVPPPLPVWNGQLRGVTGAAVETALIARQVATNAVPAAIRDADVIVSAGGGYLYDDGSVSSRRNLVRRLHTLRLAQSTNRPVVAFSQSIGPFRSRTLARLTARVLARCELVFAREEMSIDECRRLRLDNVAFADDIAFAITPSPDDPAVNAAMASFGDRAPIGVTVAAWRFGGARDAAARLDRYLDAVVAAVAESARKHDRAVAVLSQVDAHAGDSDSTLARQTVARLRSRCDAHFVPFDGFSLEQVSGFYARLPLLVATRMHSGIFALASGTPVVAIAYLPKTHGVMRRVGLDAFVASIDTVTSSDLSRKVNDALTHEPRLREMLATRLVEVRRTALAAIEQTLLCAEPVVR